MIMISNSGKQSSTLVTLVKDDDIICGRGGLALKHPGNQKYRQIVGLNKHLYATCLKTDKVKISKSIVAAIRENNGRFLEREDGKVASSLDEQDEHGNPVTWRDIGEKRAIEKTSQALREGQPKLLKKLAEDQEHSDLPQASNVTYGNLTGVATEPQSQPQNQMMPPFGQSTQPSNFYQEQVGVYQVSPGLQSATRDKERPTFTSSLLEEGEAYSSFPRNSFVENSAPPYSSEDHSNSNRSPLPRAAPESLNKSCGGGEDDLAPLPYHTEGTNDEHRYTYSSNQQQQLMSCLSICDESKSSAPVSAGKRPSVTWHLAPDRPSLFSMNMSELSIFCDDLSLDSAIDALKREAELDMVDSGGCTRTPDSQPSGSGGSGSSPKSRRSILRKVNKWPADSNNPIDPGMIFTTTLDTTPGGLNSGTDISGLIGERRKSAVAFEVGVDHRGSSRMSLCSALTDLSGMRMSVLGDSDDSVEGKSP